LAQQPLVVSLKNVDGVLQSLDLSTVEKVFAPGWLGQVLLLQLIVHKTLVHLHLELILDLEIKPFPVLLLLSEDDLLNLLSTSCGEWVGDSVD